MKSKSNPLLSLVESFFRDYLSKMRGASPHTVKAYRDSLRLFFIFIAERRKRAVATLQLDDLRVEAVSAFLDHLEAERANTLRAATIDLPRCAASSNISYAMISLTPNNTNASSLWSLKRLGSPRQIISRRRKFA
jgi:site-specific recombinase XerC